jgi:hypothetical protein
MESLVAEYEQNLVRSGAAYTVREIAEGLQAFILGKYEAVFPPPVILPLARDVIGEDGGDAVTEQAAPAEAEEPAARPGTSTNTG